MATYLVTGGYGFIGSNIVRHLLEAGEMVAILDDLTTGRESNLIDVQRDVRVFRGSVLDEKLVKKAVKGADYVLHQAALPSVQRSVENPELSNAINVTGTVNLLVAARDAGVKRVVYAASSSAYGDQPVAVKTEKLATAPKSPYAVAKLAAEMYAAAFTECYGLETVSLRYFNVFGPRQDPNSEYSAVIPKFIMRMLKGERPVIYGDGKQSRDFTYVSNNVMANVLAAKASAEAAGRMVNIACGHSYTLLDLVDAINAILGTSIEAEFQPARTGDVRHSLADISLAKDLLGYEVAVNFEDGLRRTVEWYQEQMG